jgi:drug/metabolite transporter (DMT)-like permease
MIAAGVLLGALTATAFAQLAYKIFVSRGRRAVVLILALTLFAVAQVGFFLALTQLAVGVVYMSMGFVHILVMALSKTVLDENLTRDHWVAVALISGGLLLYPV